MARVLPSLAWQSPHLYLFEAQVIDALVRFAQRGIKAPAGRAPQLPCDPAGAASASP
jgi:hypothetical protein